MKLKLRRRDFLHLATGAAALPAMSQITDAQAYPSRLITMIVAFPAGHDRANPCQRMKGALGQPVIIENMSGARRAIWLSGLATFAHTILPTLQTGRQQ